MIKKLGITTLISAIQKKVKENTGTDCYDEVAKDTPSPFYFVQFIGKRPAHTKTMWRETYTVWIHAIAEPSNSSVQIYELIESLEEALTENIALSEEYTLILQTNNGIQTIKTDETNEKHAVLEFDFTVCYGFKTKN